MEKNQTIILVVVLAVVVIVIVAAALLMGGGGRQTLPAYPGAAPEGASPKPTTESPSTGPSSAEQPSTPIGNDVAAALSAGMPVLCTMTIDMGVASGDPNLAGTTTTIDMKIEAPKMRAESSTMGMEFTVITDGTNVYMQMPAMGSDWYIMTPETATIDIPMPDEIREGLQNLPEGTTLDCQVTGDIPDSEFQLPPGVVPKDFSELMGGYNPEMYQ